MLTRAKAAISFVDLTDSGIKEVRNKTIVKRKRRRKADGGSSNIEVESGNRRSQPVRIMTRSRRRSQLPDNSVDSDVITIDDSSSQESSSSCIVGLSCLNNSRAKAPPGRAKRQRSSGSDFQNCSQKRRKSITSTSSDSSSEIQIIHERVTMPSPMDHDLGTVSTDVETIESFESDESVIMEVGPSDGVNMDEVIQDAKISQGRVKVEVSNETRVIFQKFGAERVLLRSQDSGLKSAKPFKHMGEGVSSREEVRAADSEADGVPQRIMRDLVSDTNMQDEGLRDAQQGLMTDSAANSQQIVQDPTPEMSNSTVSSEDSNCDDTPTSFENKSEKSSSEQESSSPIVFVVDDSVTLSLSPPVIGDCIERSKCQIDDGPYAESKLSIVTIVDRATTEDNETVVKVSVNQSKEVRNESADTHAVQTSINGCNHDEKSNVENQLSNESTENIIEEAEEVPSETSELSADESSAAENSVGVTHPLPDESQDREMEIAKTPATSIQSVSFPMKKIIKCEPWTSAVYDISNFEFSNGVQDERKIECVDLDDSSESTDVQTSQLESASPSSNVLQTEAGDGDCFHNNESSMIRGHAHDLAVPVSMAETIINSCEETSSDPPTFQEARIAADESRSDESSVTAVIVTHHMHPVPRQRRIYDRSVHKEFHCSNCNRQYRLLHAFKAHLLKCCPQVLPLDLPLTRVELRTKKFMFSPENIAKAMAELQSKRLVDSYRNPPSNDGGGFAKKRRGRPSSEETSQCDQQTGSSENTQDLGLASSIQGTQTRCSGGKFNETSSSEDISVISVTSTVPMPEAQEVPIVASEVEVAVIEDTNPSQKLHPGCLTDFQESQNLPAESNIEIPTASQLHEMYMTLHPNFPPVTFNAMYPDETPEENLAYILLSLEVVKPGGMYYDRRNHMVATIMEKCKCAAALKESQQRRAKELKPVGQICKSTIRVVRPKMQQVSQSNPQKFSQPTSSSQGNSLNLLFH